MNRLKLSCGVLLIGSLLWDDEKDRDKWRNEDLKLDKKMPLKLPIRYGRRSESRKNTFTMVFSNDCSSTPGKAYLVPYKSPVTTTKDLLERAIRLARAEGIDKSKRDRIYSSWSCVALFINSKTTSAASKKVCTFWKQQYRNVINPSCYSVPNEEPCIDEHGFLRLNYEVDCKGYDLLLATPVTIDAARYPTADEIAAAMIANDYQEYFRSNKRNKIETFQDNEIIQRLYDSGGMKP